MPPNDDLFPGVEGDPAPATTNGAAPTEGAPATPTPLSHEDVAAMVQEYITPNVRQLESMTATQERLSEGLTQVTEILGKLGVTGGNAEGGNPEMDVSDFLTNPEATIQRIAGEIASKQVQEQVAPLMGQMVNQAHTDIVASEKAEIDQQFGAGTWDKEFASELNPMFDRVRKDSPSQLGNRDAISKAVQAVKGLKFDALVEARGAHTTAKADAETAEQQKALEFVKSNLSGGIGMTRPSSALSGETKDFVERILRATGEKVDEAELSTALTSGSTLSEWQSAQKGAKK